MRATSLRKFQISINAQTARLLEFLSALRAGNKSFVVREAALRMAEQEGF
jgi:hypothetical protein